jgi:hypothetical protein
VLLIIQFIDVVPTCLAKSDVEVEAGSHASAVSSPQQEVDVEGAESSCGAFG